MSVFLAWVVFHFGERVFSSSRGFSQTNEVALCARKANRERVLRRPKYYIPVQTSSFITKENHQSQRCYHNYHPKCDTDNCGFLQEETELQAIQNKCCFQLAVSPLVQLMFAFTAVQPDTKATFMYGDLFGLMFHHPYHCSNV